jgi:hypothetical protein
MKRIFTILIFIIAGTNFGFAQDIQPGDGKKEQKIQALYVAYMTKELNLTEDEAKSFWPIHSQFDTELKSVDHNLDELKRQQVQLDIKKRYQDKFIKILGSNRTNDFYRKDGEFRKRLVERLHQMRQQHNNNNNRRPPRRNP